MAVDIPVVQYFRPNGQTENGTVTVATKDVAAEAILTTKLEELKKYVTITAELIHPGAVCICFDDGEFDYQTHVFKNDMFLTDKLVKVILDFDPADYKKAREAHDKAELEGPPNEEGF